MISVYVDNCAWDILFKRGVDLREALPPSEYGLAITREAELEIALIPNQELLTYVRSSISAREIPTDTYFGFFVDSLPGDQQRVGGFGEGRFITPSESVILAAEAKRIGQSQRPTGLFKNEADVSLAARSAHSVLITADNRKVIKQLPRKYGATVVNLSTWPEGLPLGGFIQGHLVATG